MESNIYRKHSNSFYSKSKFMDFINCRNGFKCFDNISCFFGGQIPVFRTLCLNLSLCVLSIGHLLSRWSTVWSPSPHGQFAFSSILKRPLLMYGAPVWKDAMKYDHNRKKYMRTQRMINIRIAKAFCTTSNETLCIVANTTPIMLKFEEVVKIYNVRK